MIKIVVLVLLLSGCDIATYSHEIAGYIKNCEERGGIAYIANLTSEARCVDGTWVSWRKE